MTNMTANARVLGLLTKLFSNGLTWLVIVGVTLTAVFTYEAFNQQVMTEHVNPALWVVTSLILFFGYAALFFYVAVYGIFFDWLWLPERKGPNVGGRLMFALTTSLAGVVALLLLQIFFFPSTGRPWYIAPSEPVFWLPTLRFIVYTGVVASLTAMSATLIRQIVRAQPITVTVTTRTPREPE